ncbi:MAG: SMP-30/gluconolactonase/LRE family protein [Labilithrix sp.]|nr:SMP-30/gluconolactonase/LRE family protein [Labilithrix sp.]MBX3221013.1 SMP-30/gluconolactonase/LRE family protein [Labilithrix sp.]
MTTLRLRLILAAVAVGAPCSIFLACSETGPDAPPRTNGCINQDCPIDGSVSGPGREGGNTLPDGGEIVYPDPLEGTTRAATLIKGRFRFTEGPVWIDGRLLFTDIPGNVIHEVFPDGGTTPWRNNSGGANGLAIDQLGRLIACEGNSKRVTRSDATRGAPTTPIAERYDDAQLNSPNDVIVRADGNVYFTDPNYSGNPNTQDDEAVYRIDPAGGLSRVEHDFDKPNGIALSPDQGTLYVVDNGAGKLLSAPVDGAGVAGTFSVLADVPGGDGMAVDDAGNLYVADDAGIDVFDRTGNKLGTVTVAVKPTNCTFGDADRRTLYITANGADPGDGGRNPQTGLYSIRLNVPGLP